MTHMWTFAFKGLFSLFTLLLFANIPNAAISSVFLNSLSPVSSVVFREDIKTLNTEPETILMSRRITLLQDTTYELNWTNIPANVNYVLFQVHSQAVPLILAYNNDLVFGNYENSTNAGLIRFMEPSLTDAKITLINEHPENVSSLVVVIGYPHEVPIPGACNMEFDVEIAPYLRLAYDHHKITVEYQKGNIGYPGTLPPAPSCEKSNIQLNYFIYQYFTRERDLTETEYFAAIETMLSVNSIRRSATQGSPVHLGPYTRAVFNAIPGQGVVYNVIVQDSKNATWVAAYTPAGSYSCDVIDHVDSCDVLIRPFGWIFCVICGFVGLFLCFFGHRYFKTEMFIFGFLTFAMMAFILITKYGEANYSVRVSMTIVLGVVGGICWVTFWWFASVPVLSVLLVSLDLGFMIACIVFYTPFGDLEILKNDINYWSTFACFMLLPGLFLLCTMHLLNIIGCAVIGSYGPILLLDRYLNTSLIYIVLNVMKRAVVPDFYLLNTNTPFQASEMSLCGVWIFLTIGGVVVQVLRERKRPPFPPPPYLTWRASTLGHFRVSSTSEATPDDERQPLLDKEQSNYQSTGPRPSTNP